MQELSEPDRLAVLPRHFKGDSYSQIGLHLGLSANAARMRAERALERLRGTSQARHRFLGGSTCGLPWQPMPQASPSVVAPNVVKAAMATLSLSAQATSVPIFHTAMALKSKLAVTGLLATAIVAPFVLQHRTIARLEDELCSDAIETGGGSVVGRRPSPRRRSASSRE